MTLNVIFCVTNANGVCSNTNRRLGIIDLQCCEFCRLLHIFSSKFQSSVTMFHHVRMQIIPNDCFSNGRLDELEESWDDMVCKIVHRKCHWKCYRSDTKCHMTPNIIGKCGVLMRDVCRGPLYIRASDCQPWPQEAMIHFLSQVLVVCVKQPWYCWFTHIEEAEMILGIREW